MVATATLKTRGIQGASLAADTDRLVNTLVVVEGVEGKAGGSFQVKQNLGTDMNVKVGSGTVGDRAVIQGDFGGDLKTQGVFITEHENGTQVLAVAASDPTNDRIDNVILRIFDDTYDSSGDDFADIEVTTGTPSGSPSPPAVPIGSFVLAEILVQNAVTQIVDGDITDKRVEVVHRGEFVTSVIYTGDDTFTKADFVWLRKVRVRLVGGGGGGGGVPASSAGNTAVATGAGGGGYSEKEILASALGTTETVTVGAGGAGGAAGDNNGVDGGSSVFGSHLNATGGIKGIGSATLGSDGLVSANGIGGSGFSGDLNLKGASGGRGGRIGGFPTLFGEGGGSHLAATARDWGASANSSVGPTGQLYGGGGGGAFSQGSSGGAVAGGAGAAGIVIVDLSA